ncbi:MAG: hypothetical protein AB7K09_03775 [Planctomycetota bacterium]
MEDFNDCDPDNADSFGVARTRVSAWIDSQANAAEAELLRRLLNAMLPE